jgi:hypothetical protein
MFSTHSCGSPRARLHAFCRARALGLRDHVLACGCQATPTGGSLPATWSRPTVRSSRPSGSLHCKHHLAMQHLQRGPLSTPVVRHFGTRPCTDYRCQRDTGIKGKRDCCTQIHSESLRRPLARRHGMGLGWGQRWGQYSSGHRSHRHCHRRVHSQRHWHEPQTRIEAGNHWHRRRCHHDKSPRHTQAPPTDLRVRP